MRSIVDPERFRAERDRMGDDVESFVKAIRADNHGRPVADVSGWLASAGESLISAARSVEPGVRVPWYGPDMTVASSITARIMETWAHTQDVVDAIGAVRLPTPRLQHVAFIGWRALPFSFMVSGRPVPAGRCGSSSTASCSDPQTQPTWCTDHRSTSAYWSPNAGTLPTLDVSAAGPIAAEWLTIAQAFAGPPGEGRQPGQFR